jgi:hypothetical protein
LVEDGSTGSHFIRQTITVSSGAADYSYSVALKAVGRGWAFVALGETTSSTFISAYINLTTGALGTTATGASWANLRTHVVSLGSSWYKLTITARKANAATQLVADIRAATADGVQSYTGTDLTVALSAWRATLAQSSLPTRLVQTTSAATSGSSQTGNTLQIKGLSASTSGLLLPDDIFEINGEIKTCTAALNSDAAGLGYLQFEPALVRSPAENDPVVIVDPMGKFLISNIKIDNEFGTQARVSYDLEHIYE